MNQSHFTSQVKVSPLCVFFKFYSFLTIPMGDDQDRDQTRWLGYRKLSSHCHPSLGHVRSDYLPCGLELWHFRDSRAPGDG